MGFLATLGSLWGTGETPEELQADSAALDARLAESQRAKASRDQAYLDYLSAEGFDDGGQAILDRRVAQEHVNLQHQRDDTEEIVTSINKAADDGLKEGSKNVTGFFSGIFDVAGEALGSILKAVPWWLWLAVAGYLFVTLGGPGLLKKHVAKRFA